jgi:hypothetical protein
VFLTLSRGKKYFSAFPTVVKISCRQTVKSSQGREHTYIILDSETTTETTQSERRTTGIDTQKSTNEKLKTEHAALQ